jgi:molybdopterin converting factor subunit 1
MIVTIQIFAALAEAMDAEALTMDVPVGATVGDVMDRIAEDHPRFQSWRDRTAVAVNHEYARGDHVLKEGDEVALIPPVSGG